MNASDMPLSKDPAFKLFGHKIPVPDIQIPALPSIKNNCSGITKGETNTPTEDNSGQLDKFGTKEQGKEETKISIQANEAQTNSKPREDQVETNSTDQEKVFKKPDKILPCPRCNSLDTKFCYFNNYNVKQPRHFCKNCQRYWTAGGTMRNVPIGAGRRKNKHLASQYRQILVSSDGVPITRMENSDSENHQLILSVKSAANLRPSAPGNGMVIKFGPDAPLCESMETVLNLGDQKRFEQMSSGNCRENIEEPSEISSMTVTSCRGGELPETVRQKEFVGLPGSSNDVKVPHQPQCYPVPPWVFSWSPAWSSTNSTSAAMQHSAGLPCISNGNNSNQIQWCPTPILAVPGFCPRNIPVQFVPASYVSYMPVWAAGTENMPMNGSIGGSSPSSSTRTSGCSGNGSPNLGKHSRDLNLTDKDEVENCILVPKTMRIDDPNEASKSPSWATLGLKPEQDNIPVSIVFKTFDTKSEGKGHISQATPILEANPAALSRSNTFQESS